MRRLLPLLLCVALVAGCAAKRLKRLEPDEHKHYMALKAYMEDGQREGFLKLKTRAERDEYLKKAGLWDRFYSLAPEVREQIYGGEVQVGWTKDMVLMAWGKPVDSKKLAGRQAQRSFLYIYRFEQTQEGALLVWEPGSKTQYKAAELWERHVFIDDDKVTKIDQKKGKW
jgi:hypothetical protein